MDAAEARDPEAEPELDPEVMIVHKLQVPKFGCTHVREGQIRMFRSGRSIYVDMDGGYAEDDPDTGLPIAHTFLGERRMTNIEEHLPPDRWEDFEAFCEDFEADPEQPPRSLPNRFAAALLTYLELVEAGLRPLPPPEPPEPPEPL